MLCSSAPSWLMLKHVFVHRDNRSLWDDLIERLFASTFTSRLWYGCSHFPQNCFLRYVLRTSRTKVSKRVVSRRFRKKPIRNKLRVLGRSTTPFDYYLVRNHASCDLLKGRCLLLLLALFLFEKLFSFIDLFFLLILTHFLFCILNKFAADLVSDKALDRNQLLIFLLLYFFWFLLYAQLFSVLNSFKDIMNLSNIFDSLKQLSQSELENKVDDLAFCFRFSACRFVSNWIEEIRQMANQVARKRLLRHLERCLLHRILKSGAHHHRVH